MMNSNYRSLILVVLALVCAGLLVGCRSGEDGSDSPVGEISDIPGEVPQKYRELVNPLHDDPEALARGTDAYRALCIQCHGESGQGDGPEAKGFDPPPGDLSRPEMGERSDGYLYWRIADGGSFEPFNSLMPAWGTLLSDTEIWELVSYLRTLSD
jgi:mono/diheme cytochrome c family protein